MCGAHALEPPRRMLSNRSDEHTYTYCHAALSLYNDNNNNNNKPNRVYAIDGAKIWISFIIHRKAWLKINNVVSLFFDFFLLLK